MKIESFYHLDTQTFCHLVYDEGARLAILIDPVADYKSNSGRVSYEFMDEVIARCRTLSLEVLYLLETHVHADHLTAAQYAKQHLGGQVLIGDQVTKVQRHFDDVFGLNSATESLFDGYIREGDTLEVGDFTLQALATPGHTPACLSYVVRASGEPPHVFVGDTLFMPDIGSARCDFPGGDAKALYASIQSIYALGNDAQLHMCHDYPPKGREVRSVTTVEEQKANNIHCAEGVSETAFIEKRQSRDAQLDAPRLILPSLQVNIRAGYLPEADTQGRRFMKIPVRD